MYISYMVILLIIINYYYACTSGNFAILLSAGFSWRMALLINFVLATTSVVGFIVGVAVGTKSRVSSQWILALAVGLFLYVALVALVS